MDDKNLESLRAFLERWGAMSGDLDDIYKNGGKSAAQFQKEIDKLTKASKSQQTTYASLKKVMDELDDSIDELSSSTDKATAAERSAEIAVKKKMKADIAAEAATKALSESTKKATTEMAGSAVRGIGQFVKNLQNDASGAQLAADLMTAGIEVAGSAASGVGKSLNALGDAAMAAGIATEGWGFVVGGALKVLGTVLDSTSETATKLAKFGVEILAKEVEKTYKAFNQMNASGAMFTDGMTGMRAAAGDAGLTVEQMSNVVKGSSDKIAAAGLSVTDGVKMLGRVGAELKKSGAQEQLLKLGYGFEEQVELMADVTRQMRLTGKTVTDQNVQRATQQYAENLRLIASITGEDAKKKMAHAEEESKELGFRQALATKSVEEQRAITDALASMSAVEVKNFKDRVIFNGAVVNEQGAIYEAQVKGARDKGRELYDAYMNHTLTYKKGAELNAKHGEEINKSILGMTAIGRATYAVGDLKEYGKTLSDQIDINNKYTKSSVQGAEANLDAKNANDELTTSVVGAERAAQDLKLSLQENLTPAIKQFSKVSVEMLGVVEDMLADMGLGPGRGYAAATRATREKQGKEKAAAADMGFDADQYSHIVARAPGETDASYNQRLETYKKLGLFQKTMAGGGTLGAGQTALVGESGPELISGPSSVLSTASTANLVRAIDAMREMTGNRMGAGDLQAQIGMSAGRMGVLRERMRGFEGFNADQLQAEFMSRPEAAPIRNAMAAMNDDESSGVGQTNAKLNELVDLMKENVNHTARVAHNTN